MEVLGLQLSMRAHTRDVIGQIHLPRLKMMEAEPPEFSSTGKRHVHPQKCFFSTRTVNEILLNHALNGIDAPEH